MVDNDNEYFNGRRTNMIQVGIRHDGDGGGTAHDATLSWLNTLQRYYSTPLIRRSPLDNSEFWTESTDARPCLKAQMRPSLTMLNTVL